jgi:hypothetical protein
MTAGALSNTWRQWIVRPPAPRRARGSLGVLLEPAVLLLACAAGSLAVLAPVPAVGACTAVGLAALVWVRPATAAYLVIGLTPLVAGIDRGVLIPFFRPNEALLLLLGGTLGVRWLVRLRSGHVRFGRPGPVEFGIVALALSNSLYPLATMLVRGRPVSMDDVLYALVLWKLVGLYWIVRVSVRDLRSVRTCLVVSVAAASVVAVVGVLQGLDLFGVRGFLAQYYAQFGDSAAIHEVPRGGSTLSLPAATADLLVINIALVAGLWLRERRYTFLCCSVGGLLVVATLAAGEFSSTMGLVLGVVLLTWVSRSPSLLGLFALVAAAGAALVWPVIAERLAGLTLASGMPESWVGRLRNLRTYFWPELSSHGNVLFGVRPSARVAVEHQATGWVWIESGYTWLLWGGGIPLFAAFLYLTVVASARGWLVARTRRDVVGAAGAAAFVGFVVVAVLMLFDPHITYRGSADLLFAVLALTAVPATAPWRTRAAGPAATGDRGAPRGPQPTGREEQMADVR